MQKEYYDMDDVEGKTKLTFKTIKGKPNKNPDDFALVINQVCLEVQFGGKTCLQIMTSSPVEFRQMKEFCQKYLGDFPCKAPYIYVPKSVLVQQPKQKKQKKSLFKDNT